MTKATNDTGNVIRERSLVFERFTVKNVSEDIENFLIEYFSASVKVENNVTRDGAVSISHIGFAKVFRSVINHIFGNSQLKIGMRTEPGSLVFVFDWISDNDSDELLKSVKSEAYLSGFISSEQQSENKIRIILKTDVLPRGFVPIYAKSKKKIYDAFYKELIVFNGEHQ
jgi:hypothetical protein